jgi:hypothetical protein
MSKALDAGKEIGDRSEADTPLAETAAFDYFGFDLGFQFGEFAFGCIAGCAAKVEFFPDSDLASGPNQALPLVRIVRHLACQQNFDPAAEKVSRRRIVRAQRLGALSAPVAVEAGREHSRVVQDQQVVGPQQAGEFAKLPVFPVLTQPSLTLPTPRKAIQMQQARSTAVCQRLLRYAFGRQIILEVGDAH